MTLKFDSLLRLSLIGALAAATVPALPSIAFAAGETGHCDGPAYVAGEPLGTGIFAGYVLAGDVRVDCAGSQTHFNAECDTDGLFVFVIAEHRDGVVYVDCYND